MAGLARIRFSTFMAPRSPHQRCRRLGSSVFIVVFWFPELARRAFLLHHAARLFKRANAAPRADRPVGSADAKEPIINANPSAVRRGLNGYEFWHWTLQPEVTYEPLLPKPPISFEIVKKYERRCRRTESEKTIQSAWVPPCRSAVQRSCFLGKNPVTEKFGRIRLSCGLVERLTRKSPQSPGISRSRSRACRSARSPRPFTANAVRRCGTGFSVT